MVGKLFRGIDHHDFLQPEAGGADIALPRPRPQVVDGDEKYDMIGKVEGVL